MASSYALPSSALPHAHQQHMHAHSQSQSSINSWKSSRSNGGLHSHPEDDGLDHEHAHSHSHAHEHSDSHSHSHDHSNQYNDVHASETNGSISSRRQPPQSLDTMSGWTEEKTAGGKSIITPGLDTVTMPYSPPQYQSHDHHHNHDPGHGHSHEHDHDHEHNHSHEHHDHDHGHGHSHAHDHHHHSHVHADHDTSSQRSLFTRMLLPYTARYPLIHAIMTEKDSRRIFYFMGLNFSFMIVQAFYGYLTDSLGLLSDSIHMFFDCVALLVGLFAAVMSKWPPSQKFPYGFGKIETLSGFANGILLMLLSVEIAFEAFERLWEGTETKRLGELFVVSSLGLIVNLVGMMAFGHHHHHGHGHDHGHSHGHSHEKDGHGCGSHGGHSHSHDNENMHGIYLHILADTLGSLSVIVSTVLTSWWGWSGWDPLASCFIAVLIFFSSTPLVSSSAKRLLLSVPEDIEYNLRTTLGGILQQRGVASYSTPKFWMDDRSGSDAGDKLIGLVHVVAARGAAVEDVRDRVKTYLLNEGVSAVVQVEREGDNSCWCTRGRGAKVPLTPKPL